MVRDPSSASLTRPAVAAAPDSASARRFAASLPPAAGDPASGGPAPQGQRSWRQSALLTLLGLGVAAVAWMLSQLAAALVPVLPWTAAGAAAGVALAAMLRWGRHFVVGGAVGLLVALSSLAMPATHALWGTAALTVALLLAAAMLTRLGFDVRFERARDVGALVLAIAIGAALPGAALIGALAAPTGLFVETLLTGWVALALSMAAVTLPLLTLDRRVLTFSSSDTRRGEQVAAVLAALAALSLLVAVPATPASLWPFAALATVGTVLVLALRGRVATASCTVLAALMLGAVLLSPATGAAVVAMLDRVPAGSSLITRLPGVGLSSGVAMALLSAWALLLLAVLLLTHAASAESRGRARRWEWALDGSRLGVADWHLQREQGFVSVAWRALTGQTEAAWTPSGWLHQVHAEDRPALAAALAAARQGQAGRQQLELRLPHEAGWRWMEATLLVVERTHGGHPTRLLATLADVHSRREAQERQLMSVALFQHLHEGLLVTDADHRALDVNPAYCQVLGVAREQVLGSVPSLLRPSPADPVARQQRAAMWAALRDQGYWRGELVETGPDGQARTLQTTISAVYGPHGDLRYHVLVLSDITEQQRQRERLEDQARFDELTRLPNRSHLRVLLDEALHAADRDGCMLVVCYLDLDHFKPVNDQHGHVAGDRLLAELAGRLRSALRSREHWADAAARLGGDEFVLLLRANTLEEARMALDRVLRVVAQPYVIDPALEPVRVTASIGATIYPIDRSDADTLLRHADHAMYGAKQTGRSKVTFFDAEQRRRTEDRVKAIGQVQEALDLGQFVLYWQPQVDMTTGEVRGFEALLRWDHPTRGLVAPMQFLPAVENTGLGSRIGDWVISQALEYLAQWRRDGLDIKVSVNVSARHLQEPDFAQRLAELLARHNEALATYLELEMLETVAHHDMDAMSSLLARCRSLGVRFALDDFGTGYSNLTYLRKLTVDTLKIDRSFVTHMLDEAQDRGIVEGVIGLARTFGYGVVAEGVESPAQARTLIEMGCVVGQGTGIAAPMPAAQVAGWTRSYRGMFTLAPSTPPRGDAARAHGR
jgi:diguanylate cyclase (GGDEF)-like protein/PAS domain S-box-containing protein